MAYILSCNKTNKKETPNFAKNRISWGHPDTCLTPTGPMLVPCAVTDPSRQVRYKAETRSLFAQYMFYTLARSITAQMQSPR
jgi:hypothetical protein